MPEYIDREDYCKNLCHCHNEYCDKESCPIWKAPAADVAPVVHGCWIEKPFLMGISRFCSKCGDNFGMPHGVYRYCPTCGARMDGENDKV